jgi:hypothetical protein
VSQSKADPGSPGWATLKDEDLLKLRICDLNLSIENSSVQDQVQAFRGELAAKSLQLKPKIYFGDEWFSPEGMVALSVPFYLAHPRLRALEKSQMLEVEGGTPEWFMKLIRHEAGHCFDHAYRFSKRRRWRELFGSPEQDYAPETYRPRPYSRSFVRNLDNWYAQSHPDEDFAETFAVWLDPAQDWREKYVAWPVALDKLQYIDGLVKEVRNMGPKGIKGYLPFSATRMRTTLEKYYSKRRREHADEYPDFFDGDLKRIFNGEPELSKKDHDAAKYMKKHRLEILQSVSYWSGERKFTINGLVKKLISRCESLNLRVGQNEARTNLEVAAYLATLVTHYLFTGKFKRLV